MCIGALEGLVVLAHQVLDLSDNPNAEACWLLELMDCKLDELVGAVNC